ncbi:replication initiation protein [Saccharothrix sp. AJ9571]|nr:replication initiation protein [Saccharothrix sp. AJ9571]
MPLAPSGITDLVAEHVDPAEVAHVLARRDFDSWAEKVRAARGCAKPVRMAGSSMLVDGNGVVVSEFSGSVFVPCKNRRAAVCESCSAHYAHDTFHLIRCGLAGGKGVPETVTGHVRVLATLTAPSFGRVHSRPVRRGKVRRCGCGTVHSTYDSALGTPLDPQSYDYAGSVLWQAHAGELWRRFTIAVGRKLARALGLRPAELRHVLRLSYAKVAEYQRRGLIHFHAVIRIDGPDGPTGPPPPAEVDTGLLTAIVEDASVAVAVRTPHSAAVGSRVLRWGDQVDVEPIRAADPGAEGWHDRRVAGYVAKYATKGTGLSEGADFRIRSAEHIDALDVSEHHKQLMRTAWNLGGLDEFAELNLRKWAHMLGFRGHFMTKSRRYSTTFTEIRRTRAEWRLDQEREALGLADDTDLIAVGDWTMTGLGYRNPAERAIAALYSELHLARRRLDGQDDDGG